MHLWRMFVITGFVTVSVLAFSACGGDTTGPGPGGEVPELPEIPPAAQIFRDDLDSENGGVGVANYTGWASWNVTEGCVDLHGPGAVNPLPGNGVYMDMDGTCDDGSGTTAGTMETKQGYMLDPGNYTLEFLIAGNSQVAQSDTLDVRIGNEISVRIIKAWSDPLELLDFDFVVAASTTETIEMVHSGGDEQGILIDAVRLRRN